MKSTEGQDVRRDILSACQFFFERNEFLESPSHLIVADGGCYTIISVLQIHEHSNTFTMRRTLCFEMQYFVQPAKHQRTGPKILPA